MSRIDEALKRAAGNPGGETAADVADTATNERLLDRFPRESSRGPSLAPFAPNRLKPATAPVFSAGTRADEAVVRPANVRLVSGSASNSIPGEQYRRLAASVHEQQAERGVKTLMVTSAVPQEGKTLTVTNLALTLSDSYARRVLLVDADVRRPGVHELLGIGNDVGLTDVLDGRPGAPAIVEVSSRFHVLPAGRPQANALAGLVSDRMRALVEDLETRYDWVLIDTPPVAVMAEAQLLARVTHGVIFVIRAGATPFAAVERAVNELGREAIVGTVLNGAAENAIPTVAYYHEYADAPK